MLDERLLNIHQVTVREQWTTKQFIAGMVRHKIGSVALWRDKLTDITAAEAGRMVKGEGIAVTSLCAAGLLTAHDPFEGQKAMDELRRAIDDTAAAGAGNLMFVAGGVDAKDKSVKDARARALERLSALTPYIRAAGIKIAVEPLHPMTCATRSVISTVGIANDWCDALGAEDVYGIAVDTYAVWWDPNLEKELKRAGKRIIGFHVNDWLPVTLDVRLDRGMMGDGLIDIRGIRKMIEDTGYAGPREVEIFSERDWWTRDPDDVIRIIKARYQTTV
jgi:sugar phosphate isomerase/epimerase